MKSQNYIRKIQKINEINKSYFLSMIWQHQVREIKDPCELIFIFCGVYIVRCAKIIHDN